MSGRSIIFLVVGVIIISATVLYRIEATSTAIVSNFNNEYQSQLAQDIAQSGVNMGLRVLADTSTWRAGFPLMNLLSGKVAVRVFDTTYMGTAVVAVRAVGIAAYQTRQEVRDTSTAFVPGPLAPISIKAAITTNAATKLGGGIIVDGRDHTLAGALVPGNGILGVWTTSSSFSIGGSATVGGTSSKGVDVAPQGKIDTNVVKTNQTYPGGFPATPDGVLGGAASGYTEGTLKSIAKSGVGGSQYITDYQWAPSAPLSGVTYVEIGSGATWSPKLSGSGILIIHNATGDSQFKQPSGTFTGLIISDDITNLSGLAILGAVVQITPNPKSVQIGTSNGSVTYSRQAIANATASLTSSGVGSAANVAGWWE
jgi:hypothetical protein